jgi:hypothetical protein
MSSGMPCASRGGTDFCAIGRAMDLVIDGPNLARLIVVHRETPA